jgi:hypothetical protein
MQDYRESIRSANRSNEAAYHDPRPFFLPYSSECVEGEFSEARLQNIA